VDGLAQSFVNVRLFAYSQNNGTNGNHCVIGVTMDGSGAPASMVDSDNSVAQTQSYFDTFNPQMGLHFAQAVESAPSAVACNFVGSFSAGQIQALVLETRM